jgi:hypothetical protein
MTGRVRFLWAGPLAAAVATAAFVTPAILAGIAVTGIE